jgi:hypothetical protein
MVGQQRGKPHPLQNVEAAPDLLTPIEVEFKDYGHVTIPVTDAVKLFKKVIVITFAYPFKVVLYEFIWQEACEPKQTRLT